MKVPTCGQCNKLLTSEDNYSFLWLCDTCARMGKVLRQDTPTVVDPAKRSSLFPFFVCFCGGDEWESFLGGHRFSDTVQECFACKHCGERCYPECVFIHNLAIGNYGVYGGPVIPPQNTITVSGEEYDHLLELIHNPPEPSEVLRRLFYEGTTG